MVVQRNQNYQDFTAVYIKMCKTREHGGFSQSRSQFVRSGPTSLALQLYTCLIAGLEQTIDSTRPTPLSENKLTTVQWNSYTIWNLFINTYFVIHNIEILGINWKLWYYKNDK